MLGKIPSWLWAVLVCVVIYGAGVWRGLDVVTEEYEAKIAAMNAARAEEEKARAEAVAASAPVPSSYTVKSGDNLANICRHFYGNLDKMDEICELNSISDPNRLAAGQKIILPK